MLPRNISNSEQTQDYPDICKKLFEVEFAGFVILEFAGFVGVCKGERGLMCTVCDVCLKERGLKGFC